MDGLAVGKLRRWKPDTIETLAFFFSLVVEVIVVVVSMLSVFFVFVLFFLFCFFLSLVRLSSLPLSCVQKTRAPGNAWRPVPLCGGLFCFFQTPVVESVHVKDVIAE